MKNLTAGYSRRNALQQMAAITMAAGLSGMVMPAIARNPPKNAGPLQPFYLPPAKEILQPGPGGLNIRTWVRSTQTNKQFSCVEAAVAPKKMGPPPHIHKELEKYVMCWKALQAYWLTENYLKWKQAVFIYGHVVLNILFLTVPINQSVLWTCTLTRILKTI